jgi:hypothetical protein
MEKSANRKYNGFVSKARVSACMYFLVLLPEKNKQKLDVSSEGPSSGVSIVQN